MTSLAVCLSGSLFAAILPASYQTGFNAKSDDTQGLVTAHETDGLIEVIDTNKMTEQQEYQLMIAGKLPRSDRFIQSFLRKTNNAEPTRETQPKKSILKKTTKYGNKSTAESNEPTSLASSSWVIPYLYKGTAAPYEPDAEKPTTITFGQNTELEYNRNPIELDIIHAKSKHKDSLAHMKSTRISKKLSAEKTERRRKRTGLQ